MKRILFATVLFFVISGCSKEPGFISATYRFVFDGAADSKATSTYGDEPASITWEEGDELAISIRLYDVAPWTGGLLAPDAVVDLVSNAKFIFCEGEWVLYDCTGGSSKKVEELTISVPKPRYDGSWVEFKFLHTETDWDSYWIEKTEIKEGIQEITLNFEKVQVYTLIQH